MRLLRSIRARFTGWYLVVLATLLVFLSLGLYQHVGFTLRRDLDAGLRHRAEQLAATPNIGQNVREGRFEEALGELIALYTPSEDTYVVSATREFAQVVDLAWVETAAAGTPVFATVTTAEGQALRVYVTQIADVDRRLPPPPPGAPPARERAATPEDLGESVLVVSRPTDIVVSALGALRATLLLAVPLTLLVAAGGGLFLARRALGPVDRMTAVAREIEETDLSKRVEVATEDELGRLARTLNAMLGRLERAFQRQRQFTADASHELRSPLAVIEAETSLALRKERKEEDYRSALETIAEETSRLTRLIDQLLELARVDASRQTAPDTPVDFSELARETIEAMLPLAEEAGNRLLVDAPLPAEVLADPGSLRRLLGNLVGNALRHTTDGSVTVSVREGRDAVELSIVDTGEGIPSEHLPHLFERFYRADAARTRGQAGAGLGLAICKQIVAMHGGEIDVESEPGAGTTFTVRLPAAKPGAGNRRI